MSGNGQPALRKRIVEAIRQSGLPFWLTFKEGSFGLAGFIEFQTDKAYIEVLFHPKQHPKHPLSVLIVSKVLPVKEIVVDIQRNVTYDAAVEHVDPAGVLERLDRFRLAYIESARELLNKEKGLVDGAYESIDHAGQFKQDVLIHTREGIQVVSIDYGRYPVAPRVDIAPVLLKHMGLQAVSELSTLKTWEPTGILHVVDVLDEICALVWKDDGKRAKDFQVLDVSQYKVPGLAKSISFKLPRGRVAGLVVEGVSASDVIGALASIPDSRAGNELHGMALLFGSPISTSDACVVDASPIPGSTGKKISKILAGMATARGPGKGWRGRPVRALADVTGIGLAAKEKVESLTRMDLVKLNIARNVMLGRKVFLVDFNAIGINRLEHAAYMKTMRAVSRVYHAIFITCGPEALVSLADQIITIGPALEATTANLGSYQAQVAGDVITIQAIGTNDSFIDTLRDICNARVVEEIRSERYKIFSTGDAKSVVVKIYAALHQYIYKITISPPRLEDFLQFTHLNQQYMP